MMRKLWPQFFMELAHKYAEQSTCVSGRRVGCVIARGNRQLAAGFNGVPSKMAHPRYCNRLLKGASSGEMLDGCSCHHAEPNAIEFANSHGIDIVGADLYVTTLPCDDCLARIKSAKIGRVFFDQYYPGSGALDHEFVESYHNEMLRQLSLSERCAYLLDLVKDVRGLDKIAILIPVLPDDEEAATHHIAQIAIRSGLFPPYPIAYLSKTSDGRNATVCNISGAPIVICEKQSFLTQMGVKI